MNLSRADFFVLVVSAGFLLPLVMPGVGLDFPYFFVTVMVLLAWFMIKWDLVKSIATRSRAIERAAGVGIIASDYAFNYLRSSHIGILDLIVIFIGATIVSFGITSVRKFWVPSTYGLVLLAGYQIENLAPNYSVLQNWLASVMASSMNALGIGATATGQFVLMSLSNGTPLILSLEGSCTGLQGILAFGMLSTMALLDTKPRFRRLILILALGFVGAFLINIARLFVVFLTFEFLGVDAGDAMHVYFGYFIFFLWVIAFWSIAFRYLVPGRPISLVPIAPATAQTSPTSAPS